MNIQITGRQMDVTEPMQAYIKQKFSRLARHAHAITHAHFTLQVEKKIHHEAKAMLVLSGAEIIAECTAKDMYEAIDLLMDKLDRQIIRHKETATNH